MNFLMEIGSFFGFIILIFTFVTLYNISKSITSPKTFKGKIACILLSLCALSFILLALDKPFIWLQKHAFLYFLVIASIGIIILFVFYKIRHKLIKKYSLNQLDNMEGHQFEYACADILKSNGFKEVTVTQGSGDFGVDILAQKNGIKYAIQCKCYSHKLDNTPIQEVIGGLAYYNCSKGAVMTNQYFTEPAKELATVNNVELWDRDVLNKMLL